MANYPKDRFDSVPDDVLRVGAHRAPAKKGRGWIAFTWAVVATLVLVTAGLYGLSSITGDLTLPFQASSPTPTPKPTPSATPTAEPKLDAKVPITVLNGTPTAGLATKVGDYLKSKGWNGAALGVGTRANASENTVEKTVVYYADAADEGAARAIVQELGIGSVRLSDVFKDRITVVLGADYKPQS